MKLDDFITESLLGIKNGIHQANTHAKGENPKPDAPTHFFLRPGSKQESGAGIEFDVAVTTRAEGEGKTGAKVSLAVVEASFGGGASVAKESVSRIRFVVTIGNWVG